jgi:hypothetical protein
MKIEPIQWLPSVQTVRQRDQSENTHAQGGSWKGSTDKVVNRGRTERGHSVNNTKL